MEPTRPFKDYQYVLDYQGTEAAPKSRIFLKNPTRDNANAPTFELNTVFTIKLQGRESRPDQVLQATLNQIKTEIDQLASEWKSEDRLTSTIE